MSSNVPALMNHIPLSLTRALQHEAKINDQIRKICAVALGAIALGLVLFLIKAIPVIVPVCLISAGSMGLFLSLFYKMIYK
jgi:hypothetical protein